VTLIKHKKINFVTLWAVDIIRTAYYIHGHDVIKLIFAVLRVSLNDGPYTLLSNGSF